MSLIKQSSIFVTIILGMIIFSASLIGIHDAHAAEEEKGGSFLIHVTGQACAYQDSMLENAICDTKITGKTTIKQEKSGQYKSKAFDGTVNSNFKVRISSDNKKLILEPSCKVFPSNCDAINIDLDDKISKTVSNFNSALKNHEWKLTMGRDSALQYPEGLFVQTVYKLNAISETDLSNAQNSSTNSGGPPPVATTCLNSGGAGSIGWAVCPILDFLSNASQSLYDAFVEPALQVDPKLFTGVDGSNGTRQGWEIFRNIANTLFIILLLIVVFSQLTGVGIDNYGIKKILPKLIIAAILINLSYWICVIFVDISNILGNAFQDMFNAMGNGLTMPAEINGLSTNSTNTDANTAATAIVGVGLLAAAVSGIWAAAGGGGVASIGALILVLLVAALNIAVTLFFLFILFAAREAAIVILTVISPLAFALYMLPNTKTFFDKWWKAGQALLLVYPIAGLLVGGGNFVSKVILAAGAGDSTFFSFITAMIVGVVPIYFIPGVLKNSFQSLGKIGARLSNVGKSAGSRFSGNVNRNIRGTNRYKAYENERARSSQMRAANRNVNRLKRRQRIADRFGRDLSASDQRALARSSETLDRMQNEDTAARTALMQQDYGDQSLNDLMVQWRGARDSGNGQDLEALTNVINTNYGARGVNQIATAIGEVDENDANFDTMVSTLRSTMRNNSAFAGNLSKTGDAFDMISDRGRDRYGNRHGLSYFTQHMSEGSVTSVSDWANQTTATIQRAVDAQDADGNYTFSSDRIREILESDDPAIRSKLAGDPGKRDALQAALYNREHPPNPQINTVADAAKAYRAEQQAAADAEAAAAEAAANAPTVVGGGAYKHAITDNVVHLNQMSDGTFVDAQSGQTVDITNYKRQ